MLIPESFQLSAYDARDGHRVWWVRGLACEMKSVASIDGDIAYINGWGFPQNQPGRQVATVSFEEGLKRYDKNGDGRVGADEISGDEPMDKMLGRGVGFPAFDLDRNGSLDAREWDVFRSMMAAENGLLAISLGGHGDMTATAVRWRYQRPVPQVPSTLLYQGVLFMVNDSGILLAHRSGDGQRPETGQAEGGDRQVLRLADRRRRQGLSRQPGWDGVGRQRHGRLGHRLGQRARRRGVCHARNRRRPPLRANEEHALLLRHRDHAVDRDRYDLGWPIA